MDLDTHGPPPGFPRRIVATTCSNTEIVCALGCADRLVGVDDHSDHPPEVVARLPRVGPDLGVDAARIAALEPDLVLASLSVPGHERVVEALEEAGLPLHAPRTETLADVFRDIRQIGALLGVPGRAEALAKELEAALAPKPPPPRRPRVAVEWWPKPAILPGRRSWATELIERAGGIGVLGHEDHSSRPVSFEAYAALEPDLIVVSWCGIAPDKLRPEVVLRRPELARAPAVRARRVVAIEEAFLGRPGPRLAEGYRRLCEAIAAAAA
ncbi:MAG: cobalamin-binding protein [Deltaproteobacteria bacterium]|nr:MAG: cobalamin-binding protein [Deltaproteobacteria bacterium]